jgi:O-Antigen ligase
MNSASMRRAAAMDHARRVDWGATAIWLLSFGLVAYLGLKGGGYDPLVHDPVGIAVWWIALAGVLIGVLPRRRLPALAWAALGLLAAFVLWTALSLSWTESAEKTSADLARVAGYLGVFCLALLARHGKDAQRLVGAVAAGISLVALVALLSRLHPAWFPAADQTARFLVDSRERLSYPLNYWNGLGALLAIGLPLVAGVAVSARSVLFRGLATAALPALGLTLFFTLSRGSIAAAALALAVFLAFAADRLPKLLTLLVAAAGTAILVLMAAHRDSLQHGLLDATARHQGDQMLPMTILVCVVVGLAGAAIAAAEARQMRPRWTVVSRQRSLAFVLAGLLVVLVAAAAVDAPGRLSTAWGDFKQGGSPGSGTDRLGSVAGQGRYQFWRSAVDENSTDPLIGTGSGTFEYWWARNATIPEVVRDTHSLYLQTLGELGIAGLLLVAAFLLVVLVGGARNALRASGMARTPLAAALAGCLAFCVTAAFDWMWQIPVLPVALLLLASVLLVSAGAEEEKPRLPVALRLGFAAAALIAIVAIAIPLASTSLVRKSEAEVRKGNLSAALDDARSAQNAQPDAASPRLQQALVLEAQGELDGAATAARAATERESTNWRTWLVLSRIEAERGKAEAAVRDYGRARSLNPRFPLFNR